MTLVVHWDQGRLRRRRYPLGRSPISPPAPSWKRFGTASYTSASTLRPGRCKMSQGAARGSPSAPVAVADAGGGAAPAPALQAPDAWERARPRSPGRAHRARRPASARPLARLPVHLRLWAISGTGREVIEFFGKRAFEVIRLAVYRARASRMPVRGRLACGPGPGVSAPGYVPSDTGRCAGPRRLIRPFQATWPSRASPGNRAVSRARAIEASSLASDAPRQ